MPTPAFIRRLRERVGHDPLWLVGVTAVVIRGSEVLLVKPTGSAHWTPVGGIVEPGEHSATAAEREVLEETRVVAEVERLAAVGVSPEYDYRNGDRAQFTNLVYRLRYSTGEPEVGDDESTAVAWFPIDNMPPMAAHFVTRIGQALSDRIDTIIDRP